MSLAGPNPNGIQHASRFDGYAPTAFDVSAAKKGGHFQVASQIAEVAISLLARRVRHFRAAEWRAASHLT